MQLEIGSIQNGKVTGVVAFGAFVELPDGQTGLVHISEVASEFVDDVSKFLKVGQEVKVKVVSVENGKIGLSIKKANEDGNKERGNKPFPKKEGKKRTPYVFSGKPEEFEFKKSSGGDMSFDDMLLKFKQDSDERISDLKRNTENKRNGGYRR